MKLIKTIFIFVLAIIIIMLLLALSSLILWGVGNFIIWAFNINYEWTYWQGVACALIIWILSSIFKK